MDIIDELDAQINQAMGLVGIIMSRLNELPDDAANSPVSIAHNHASRSAGLLLSAQGNLRVIRRQVGLLGETKQPT